MDYDRVIDLLRQLDRAADFQAARSLLQNSEGTAELLALVAPIDRQSLEDQDLARLTQTPRKTEVS